MIKIKSFLTDVFGPNWPVKLWGVVTGLCAFIALNPKSVEFLPDGLEKFTVGIASLMTGAGIIGMGSVTKGSKVTGGAVPATPEAKDRIDKCEGGNCPLPPEENIPRALPVNPMDADKYPDASKPLFTVKD